MKAKKSAMVKVLTAVFAVCLILGVFLIRLFDHAEKKEYQSDFLDTFGFSLQPGEQASYGENLVFTEASSFAYQVTWTRTGLPIEIGLIDKDGHEYLNEEAGGSSRNVIEKIPAGTYQFVVRSCQENSQSLAENTLVEGAAGFMYDSMAK